MKSGTGLGAAPQSALRGLVAALLVLVAELPVFAPARPASASNLLINGSFETFYTYATDPGTGTPLTAGAGWHPFAEAGSPYFMSTRQFNDSVWGCHCWVDAYDGEDSQIVFTPNGSQAWTGGLYQKVSGLSVGVAYALSGRVASNGNDVQAGRKVGIDPYGGTDPRSPNVVWGDESWATARSHYQNKYVAAVAKSTTITVFVRMVNPGGAASLSEGFVDAFVLEVAPVAHTVALPARLGAPSFPVSWGVDAMPAGTLFDRFQVQVRQGGGPWSSWFDNTQSTSAQFNGGDCQTYYFQTRAMAMYVLPLADQQVGDRLPSYWPDGDGQTHTSVIPVLPASQVITLTGTQRCTQFPVTWSGSTGSCGITGYDVQVRGGGGIWVDWLAGAAGNQANFRGVSGHTYSFRSRARGFGGYLEPYGDSPDAFTTVVLAPPVAAISPLPAVELSTTFPITWSGGAAGCGIASYDVFTRSVSLEDDQDSGWMPWLTGTQSAGAAFVGQFDTYYTFRVRARDTLGNWSEAGTATSILSEPRSVLAASSLVAEPAFAHAGEVVTYHLWVSNTGSVSSTAWVTQTLPVERSALLTETVQASRGTAQVSESGITWSGLLTPGLSVAITTGMRLDEFVGLGTYITSSAQIRDGEREPLWRTARVLVPYQAYLPVVASGSP